MSNAHFKIDRWNIAIGTALDSIPAMTGGEIARDYSTVICHGEGYTLFIYFLRPEYLSKATPVTDLAAKKASICLPLEALAPTMSLLNLGRTLYGLVHSNANWNNLTDNWNM
jgi:hypothetical protein